MTLNKTLILKLFVIISLTIVFDSFSQGQKKIIQLSGVVVGQDSISGVGGVHIYLSLIHISEPTRPY